MATWTYEKKPGTAAGPMGIDLQGIGTPGVPDFIVTDGGTISTESLEIRNLLDRVPELRLVGTTGVVTPTPAQGRVLTLDGVLYSIAADGTATQVPVATSDALTAGLAGVAGSGQGVAAAEITANGALTQVKHNRVNATSGAVTVTLPTGQPDRTRLSVEKTDATRNAVTISGNIRGSGGATISLTRHRRSMEFVADSSGAWWPVAAHDTDAATGLSSVIWAPLPTGVAATDTANLIEWYASLPAGGVGRLHLGRYRVNATLVWDKNVAIEGAAAEGIYGSTGFDVPTVSPFIRGTIIEQVTAATDIISCPTPGGRPRVKNVCFTFAANIWFVNTGHVFNCVAPTVSGHPDTGLQHFRLENVWCLGVDGNHYALTHTNTLFVDCDGFRAFGGGGIRAQTDSTGLNAGNGRYRNIYISTFCGGSAHAVEMRTVSGSVGQHNLDEWIGTQTMLEPFPTSVYKNEAGNNIAGVTNPTSAQSLFKADESLNSAGIQNYKFAGDCESVISGARPHFGTRNKKSISLGGLYGHSASGGHKFALLQGTGVVGQQNEIRAQDLLLSRDAIQEANPTTASAGTAAGVGATATLSSDSDDYRGKITVVAGNPLTAPVLSAVTANASGGSFASGTYYYKITFRGGTGQTTGSNEQSASVAANGTVTIPLPASPAGCTGISIYRATSTGNQTNANSLVATVAAGTTTYTDLGNATVTGNVPGSNTTGPVAFGVSANITYGVGNGMVPKAFNLTAGNANAGSLVGSAYVSPNSTACGISTPSAMTAGGTYIWYYTVDPGLPA